MRTIVLAPFGEIPIWSSGSPRALPVVLGSGLGSAWFDWDGVSALLSPFAHVTVYSRPVPTGSALAGAVPVPPPLSREVAVLDAVLDHAGHPAVLVGHSIAALHMEAYARLRPDRVRGVVLADPDPERIGGGRPLDLGSVLAGWALGAYRVAAVRTAAGRGVRRFGARVRRAAIRTTTLGYTDPAPAALVRGVYQRPEVAEAALAMLAAYADQAGEVDGLRHTHPLPPVPWVVLTAERAATRHVVRRHRELAALVPGGRQVGVAGSRHMMPLDRPDAIASAVRDLLV